MPLTIRDILELLHPDGWQQVAPRGSRLQLKHPLKAGGVTVSGKPGDDVAAGTLSGILKQAQLKR